jgi:Xaa-Pro aminopeptidase
VDAVTQGTLTHVTSPPERERRYAALRAAMSGQGLDALVVCGRGDEFVRGRVQYVSDIFQWAGWGMVVLPLDGDPVFLVDPLWGLGRAALAGWIQDLRMTQTPGQEVGAILGDLGLQRGTVGVVGLADITSHAHARELEAALPDASLEDATDLFDDVRAIKSQEEIDNCLETSAILRTVFKALEAELRPGVQERDVLAEAHRLCRQYACVDGIALMGRPPFNSFTPGSDGVIERDDIIVIDLEWGGPSGYWVELRRVFSFGPPPDAARRFWDTRIESFAACVDAMKDGASSEEILAARDRAYQKHGQSGAGIIAYTAHGIGVDSLEPPWVPGKERTLRENMVVNLHPSIAFADPAEGLALGGISIADNVLVTSGGGRRMTDQVDEWIVLEP